MKIGTAITATWSPGEIILGADGKEISSDAAGTGTTSKIHQVRDDLFFALSGLVAQDETGFDVSQLVDRACRQGANPEEVLKTLDALVEGPLTDSVDYTRKHRPDDFKNYLRGRAAFGVIIAGRAGNDLFVARRGFITKLRGQEVKLQLQGCIISNDSNVPFDFWNNGSAEIRRQFWKRLPWMTRAKGLPTPF